MIFFQLPRMIRDKTRAIWNRKRFSKINKVKLRNLTAHNQPKFSLTHFIQPWRWDFKKYQRWKLKRQEENKEKRKKLRKRHKKWRKIWRGKK